MPGCSGKMRDWRFEFCFSESGFEFEFEFDSEAESEFDSGADLSEFESETETVSVGCSLPSSEEEGSESGCVGGVSCEVTGVSFRPLEVLG